MNLKQMFLGRQCRKCLQLPLRDLIETAMMVRKGHVVVDLLLVGF